MQLKPACLVLVNACVFHPQLFQLKKRRGQWMPEKRRPDWVEFFGCCFRVVRGAT